MVAQNKSTKKFLDDLEKEEEGGETPLTWLIGASIYEKTSKKS